jgi:membrane protein
MDFVLAPLERWLWRRSAGDDEHVPRWLTFARYTFALLRDFIDGELNLRATSLVYTTMVAIVPLLALSFTTMKALGLHRTLEPLIIGVLSPIGPRSDELADRIMHSIDNANSSMIASVSVVLLIVSALSMAQKVETSFNFVWRVEQPRSYLRRFGEYLGIILIGPTVMSLAIGFTASLESDAIIKRIATLGPVGHSLAVASGLAPYLLVIATFVLLYVYVPNTRVRLKPAIIAAIVAGASWVSMGGLFTTFLVNVTRNEAIYSGFAIVLAAMIWLQLSWLILLLGAQLAFYLQNPAHLRPTPVAQSGASIAPTDPRA